MRKKLMTALSLLLCLVTAFAFTACGDKEQTVTVAADMFAKSVAEKTLEQDYITLNLEMLTKMSADDAGTAAARITVYLKKTDKGYDMVLSGTANTALAAGSVADTAVDNTVVAGEFKGYMIDGLAVMGAKGLDGQFGYESSWVGPINDILTQLGVTEAQIAEKIGELVGSFAGDVQKTAAGCSLEHTEDLTQTVNSVLSWLKANKDKTPGAILAEAGGLTEEQLTAKLTELFKDGQTVAEFVRALETFLNDMGLDVNFKTLVDELQTASGKSTAELVAALKEGIPELAEMPAPTDGQTIYDYAMGVLGGAPLDDVIAMVSDGQFASASELGAMLAGMTGEGAPTLAQLIDGFTGEGVTEMLAMFSFKQLAAYTTLKTNGDDLITEFTAGLKMEMQMSVGGQSVTSYSETVLRFTLDYGQPAGVTFAIPADIVVEPVVCWHGLTEAGYTAALENGCTFKVYMGQNWDYTPVLGHMYIDGYLYEAVDGTIQNGDTVYATMTADGQVTVTAAAFQAMEQSGELNVRIGENVVIGVILVSI